MTPQCSWHLQAPAAAPTVETGSFPPCVPPEVAEIQEPAALDMLRALQTTAVAVPAMGAEVQTTYVANAEEGSSLRGEPCSGQYMPHRPYAVVLCQAVSVQRCQMHGSGLPGPVNQHSSARTANLPCFAFAREDACPLHV